MTVDPQYIRVGMNVVGRDSEQVGRVKEVRSRDILVDRPFARDVYVPIEAVQAIIDATPSDSVDPHVVLTVRGGSVGSMGWPRPR